MTASIKHTREVLVRDDESPSEFGKRPEERDISELLELGVINLDKPPGPSSHEVVAWFSRIIGISRIAHGGTLDPKVTGILPVLLNRAVKVVRFLLNEDKEYVGVMKLHGDVSGEEIVRTLAMFRGPVYQKPPLRSAVKRTLRVRRIHDVKVLEVSGRNVLFWIWCEAGTYVRKFCYDAGLILGVGAHMQELRRVRSGCFTEAEAVTMQEVVDAFTIWKESGNESYLRKVVKPVEQAVQHLPRVIIRNAAVDAVAHGAQLAVPGVLRVDAGVKVGDIVAILTLKGELVAIGKAEMRSEEMVIAKKGIAVKPLAVTMKPGVYPSLWKKHR
ncbi:MAG: RNA-guided pseudouridylation complex pseudouridine synthase subunit Cbf5 [Thermofilaceae archaeon]